MSYLPQKNTNLLIMNISRRMCIYLTGEFDIFQLAFCNEMLCMSAFEGERYSQSSSENSTFYTPRPLSSGHAVT